MFDNICKFLAETFPSDFAAWLLGEPIPLTELKPTELSSEPIRADSLILLQAQKIILHLEFQAKPDPNMGFRMLDYRLKVYRKFPDKRMRQIVIYLLPTNSPLVHKTVFAIPNTRHRFEAIRMWEQNSEALQQSKGLLPLAVLGKTAERERTLRQIAQKIEEIEEVRERSNVAAATSVLAGLVLKKDLIQRILRSDIMKESPIYQDILAEGRAEGRAEGEAIMQRQIAQNLLRSGMSIEMVAQVTGLTIAEARSLQEQ